MLIDRAMIERLSAEALASRRGRKNFNLHPTDEFPAHRLLNAIEPGSYVQPHRHLDARKDETILVPRGRLGLLIFDDAGEVASAIVLGPDEEAFGIDLTHGTWHTVLALATGTVFFEAKAGPFLPLRPEERAAWAPAEGDAAVPGYLARLAARFS